MVSWADAQESDEEMVGTDETSKRKKVQVIEAALQLVNEECTEFTGGGEELDPVKLFGARPSLAKSKFGQTKFGHGLQTKFGQDQIWPRPSLARPSAGQSI